MDFDKHMGASNRRRHLVAGAWVIGLLSLATLMMALASELDNGSEVSIRILWMLGTAAMGVFDVLPLLRGTQKGQPLAFEPFRWQLIVTGIFAALSSALITWQLLIYPHDLLSIA
jgi:hypothetical protein